MQTRKFYIEPEDIIRRIAIFLIIVSVFYSIYCIIKNTPIYITGEGIRIEKNSEYPNTDNPIAYGVTTKEYTAEVRK